MKVSIEIGHTVTQEHFATRRKGAETRRPLIRDVVDRTLSRMGKWRR